jgi:hypothetical protein
MTEKELLIKYENWLDGLGEKKYPVDFNSSLEQFEWEFDIELPMTDAFEQELQETYEHAKPERLDLEDWSQPVTNYHDLKNITSPSGE